MNLKNSFPMILETTDVSLSIIMNVKTRSAMEEPSVIDTIPNILSSINLLMGIEGLTR